MTVEKKLQGIADLIEVVNMFRGFDNAEYTQFCYAKCKDPRKLNRNENTFSIRMYNLHSLLRCTTLEKL